MNQKYSFKYLKTRIKIGQILSEYGLDRKLKRRDDRLYGPCPIHGGDNPTAFRVDLIEGVWRCFTNCGGGDLVELIVCVDRCSHAQAARTLSHLVDHSHEHASLPVEQSCSNYEKRVFNPFRYRLSLNPRSPFLKDKKMISIKTAAHFEAGTSYRSSFLKGMVGVRVHDMKGEPLGYCGRRLNPGDIDRYGKWRFPVNFPKNQILFNAHRAVPYKRNGIVIVECPWAAMRLTQAGVPNVVALLGTSLSSLQIEWFIGIPAVLLMLDGDEAGRKAVRSITKKLSSVTKVTSYNLPAGLEPEDLSDYELSAIAARHLFSF